MAGDLKALSAAFATIALLSFAIGAAAWAGALWAGLAGGMILGAHGQHLRERG